jgi:hypothetical protein
MEGQKVKINSQTVISSQDTLRYLPKIGGYERIDELRAQFCFEISNL